MSERDTDTLTIYHAQSEQPWVLPLSEVNEIGYNTTIWGSHAVLHAAKSVGKLAAVFENLDHSGEPISPQQVETIRGMSADLITIALRFANLYEFDLAEALVERVEEKNNVTYPKW